jgi:hypothetical protein
MRMIHLGARPPNSQENSWHCPGIFDHRRVQVGGNAVPGINESCLAGPCYPKGPQLCQGSTYEIPSELVEFNRVCLGEGVHFPPCHPSFAIKPNIMWIRLTFTVI